MQFITCIIRMCLESHRELPCCLRMATHTAHTGTQDVLKEKEKEHEGKVGIGGKGVFLFIL